LIFYGRTQLSIIGDRLLFQ